MKTFNKHFKMDEKDALLYTKEKLRYFDSESELKAKEIGDGNINYVFKVWNVRSGQSIIIKQADVLLRSSGRPLDIDRNRIESEVLMLQEKAAPGLTPQVIHYDPVMCALTMEDISDHENLRTALLERKTFPRLADHISTFMVNTLLPTTDLVMGSAEKKDNVKRYINKDLCKISEDLVFTEPYTDYKNRNVVLPENMDFVKRELYEQKDLILEVGKLKYQFMNNTQALIHGDLHSGSIFVTKNSTKVLDPEFAFYGPIGYDLGNVLGNLFFAWVNAYVTEGEQEMNFLKYIENTIEETVDLFKEKFTASYKDLVTEIMAKQEGYMEWYLGSILSDAAGVAGLEIIRRVVGDAKVMDVTMISDMEKRLKAERLLIRTAKNFIMRKNDFMTGKEYIREIYNNK